MTHISEWPTSIATWHLCAQQQFPQPSKIPSNSNEAYIILALQALQNDKNLSERAAAKIYGVDRRTLGRRRAGYPARRDITPNSKKLTQSEEEAIIQYIIELDVRIFLLRLRSVEDIANQLLYLRNAPPISKL